MPGVGLGHGTRGAERYLETELPALAEATRVLQARPHADTPLTLQMMVLDTNTNLFNTLGYPRRLTAGISLELANLMYMTGGPGGAADAAGRGAARV